MYMYMVAITLVTYVTIHTFSGSRMHCLGARRSSLGSESVPATSWGRRALAKAAAEGWSAVFR